MSQVVNLQDIYQTKNMDTSDQTKIQTFDNYVMRGGDRSLQNIEDLCDYGFYTLGLEHEHEPELFNEVVIDVIRKLTGDLN